MRRFVSLTVVLLLLANPSPLTATAPAFPGSISFDPSQGEFPEGIAADKAGNLYVSFDAPRGEVRRFSPSGEESVLIDFGTPGALGLAVDPAGYVYVARPFPNNGVYRIDRRGGATVVPGTQAILFPNALAFDNRGNLYVSESFSMDPPLAEYPGCDIGLGHLFGMGGIWRVPPGGSAERWLRHDLLTGVCAPNPIPFPVGANGIGYRHGMLYVNNTEKGMVVRIPVGADGHPGSPSVLAVIPDTTPPSAFGPPNPDGLAMDVHGNLYLAIINQSRLVKVSADGSTIETLATSTDGLDFPASLAFGTGKGMRQTLFATNYAIGPPGGAGPGLLALDAGAPGLPLP